MRDISISINIKCFSNIEIWGLLIRFSFEIGDLPIRDYSKLPLFTRTHAQVYKMLSRNYILHVSL